MDLIIRPISKTDISVIAQLHAQSWRSAYRGILRDEYLAAELEADRVQVWTERLSGAPQEHFGYLAFDAVVPVGFVYACGLHDPVWGTLIDNLHVMPERAGRGIGKLLLQRLGENAKSAYANVGLHLWVFEQNTAARSFYERIGAKKIHRTVLEAPGGGEVAEWLYAWNTVDDLLDGLRA
jgi:GNAT superfamily N-acetyltransferase